MTATRPKNIPRKIPLAWWHQDAWIRAGRKGKRPVSGRMPVGFHLWRHWHLQRAKRAHVKHHVRHRTLHQKTTIRTKIVHHARWGAAPKVSPQMHYTEDSRRDDWLVENKPTELPQWTDCSGFGTECAYVAHAPDPNGLAYRMLGYTGTVLATALAHGRVFTDVSKALPGDPIVIGPGNGEHEVVCVEAGNDPLVATHGGEGVQIQRLSVDPREPKRVCQTL